MPGGIPPKKNPIRAKALPAELGLAPVRCSVRVPPRLCAAVWQLLRGSPQQNGLEGPEFPFDLPPSSLGATTRSVPGDRGPAPSPGMAVAEQGLKVSRCSDCPVKD